MKTQSEAPVIIYDGNCSLCNSAVKFLKTDKASGQFRFISSSGPDSSGTFSRYGIDPGVTDKTVILIEGEKIFTKSDAIIRALQKKGKAWYLAGILFTIPRFIRDYIYDLIANNRTKQK